MRDALADDYFPATGDDRNQKSNQGCLGDFPQVQAGAVIEKLHVQTSSPAVRRSDDSDDMLRIWNMGTHKRARKNDTIDASQNAPTHHTNKKRIPKDRETKKSRPAKNLTTLIRAVLTKLSLSQRPGQRRVIRE